MNHLTTLICVVFISLCSANESVRILQLSDIHYNPAFNPNYPKNWCQSPDLKPASDKRYKYGMIGCNPPIELIDATFSHMKANGPYDYIALNGDVCSHELNDALFKECMVIMKEKIHQYFGNTPVVFTMGNNDTPNPYNITCSDYYFSFLYETFSEYIPSLLLINTEEDNY